MNLSSPYFSGIGGTGMSAIAQFLAARGSRVSGSDRSFDQGQSLTKKSQLEGMGMQLFSQDGKGLEKDCSCLVLSTAIENNNPERIKAQALDLPIYHRAEVLAHLCSAYQTIAIAGTSGKSTVTGMAFHVLRSGGLDPSLITGGNLLSLQQQGYLGNAYGGKSRWLLIEADESDGSLIHYHPALGVILNIEKDHKEIPELIPLFKRFADQSSKVLINMDDTHCRTLYRPSFETLQAKGWEGEKVERIEAMAWGSRFRIKDVVFEIAQPGFHNLFNSLCAIRIGRLAGVSLEQCAQGLKEFLGIERRAIRYPSKSGAVVVDDFAHNPAKIRAFLTSIQNARSWHECEDTERERKGNSPYPLLDKPSQTHGKGRIIAIFHPHGFAPMKLMRHELVQVFTECLVPPDILILPEIYFAGGTADKSLSSQDLVADVNRIRPRLGHFFATKNEVKDFVQSIAQAGDWVLSMGARDPELQSFAQNLAREI